ncbi:MAG: hypothetical protein Q4F65_12555 [Propionibacteriaceae bacterium]|nr:hypothetical protein [Propionibacteriaceae bacterium]
MTTRPTREQLAKTLRELKAPLHSWEYGAADAVLALLDTQPSAEGEAFRVTEWAHARCVSYHTPEPGEVKLRGANGADALSAECAVCGEVVLPYRFERAPTAADVWEAGYQEGAEWHGGGIREDDLRAPNPYRGDDQ